MSVGEYALGIAWLAILLAMLAWGARRLVRRVCPGWSGPIAWLAEISTAIGMLVVASQLAGLVGGFTRWGLLGAAAAIAAAVAIASTRISPPALPSPPAPPQPCFLVALGIAVAIGTAAVWVAPTLESLDVGMYRQDSTWYHLTFSADFFQSGRVGGVHFTDPMRLTAWFYPQNSELLHGVGMVALRSDFLSPLFNLGWMLLTLFAAWCVGRPFAAGPLAVLAAGIVLASDMMQPQAGNAPSDIPALFFLVATLALLVNAQAAIASGSRAGRVDLGTRAPGALALAGVAAGLAIGTKITLLPAVATLTLALVLLSPGGRRLWTAAIWAGGVFATGSYWYLRNALQAGNPFPWVDLGPLATPDQVPLYPRPPHSVADYAFSPEVWTDWFVPGLEATLGPLWPLVLLGVAAGAVLVLRTEDPIQRALGAVAIVSAIAYALIPITAPGPDGVPYGFGSNLRYLAPAMIVGLLALTLVLASRSIGWIVAIAAAMGVTFVAVLVASDSWRLAAAPSSLPLGVAAVLVPFAIATLRLRGTRNLGYGIAAALLCLVAAGYAEERTYAKNRYRAALAPPADNPGFRSSPQWRPLQEWARSRQDERIGIVGPPGAFGQYVFYGADLSNEVQYVGRPGSNGAFRPIANCFEWRRTVNAEDFTYLVITPALALGPAAEPQESLWSLADPAVELVLSAPPASIYRVRGQLDPRACAGQPQLPVLPVPWGGVGVPGVAPGPLLPPGLPGARSD
jgi:hypothetical protein